MVFLRASISILGIIFVAMGCGRPPADSTPIASARSADVIVVGEPVGAPRTCPTHMIAAQTAELFAAISGGANSIGDRFFGIGRRDVPFAWMSFTDTVTGMSFTERTSAESLNTHLAKLGKAGNEFVLRGLDFTGRVPERSSIGLLIFFDVYPEHSVRDDNVPRRGFGKAEYHCPSARFLVMSLATMAEDQWQNLYRIHLQNSN